MEVGEVLVICKNLYRERRAMEVMVPGFQSVDNSKEFMVIDVIIPLYRGK